MKKENVLNGLEMAKTNVVFENQLTSNDMAFIIDSLIYLVEKEKDNDQ